MAEEYFHQEYEKWLVHPNGTYTIVHDKHEEERMLADGYVFSTSAYGVETAPAAPQVHQGGFRQPGYVDPSLRGGASPGTPNPQHVAAQQAASQAEARRQQAEAAGRGDSPADHAAQAEVTRLEEEAKQREEARQREQAPEAGRSTRRS
jgi:hypothetical protein